jgi:hypothetical protein
MRNFYLVFLALAFSTVGLKTLAQVPEKTNQTQTLNPQLAQQFLQFSQEVVEKDGLFFQTVVSQPNFLIPRRNSNRSIPIKMGVRIRNNTKKTIRLTSRDMSEPILVKNDGQNVLSDGGCTFITAPTEAEFPWVMPGQSVTFFVQGTIYWRKNRLNMSGRDVFGCYWHFLDLKPGKYTLQFHYQSSRKEAEVYKPERKILSGIWTGKVLTPAVEFTLTID